MKSQKDTDGRRFPWAAALLPAMMFAAARCVADIPPGWSTNLTATLKSAELKRQPVLLYYTASWCGPCKMMQANTLPDPVVRNNLTNFACVALDLDANQASAREHSVSAIPAFLILTAAGDEVLRTEGYREAAPFNTWLDKAKAAFAEAQEKVAAFVKAQTEIEADLKSSDATVRQAALTKLFDLCSDREPSHQTYAAAQLKALAVRDPKALLNGLEHPKLAARIAVANQLRDIVGDNFVYDPWASPADRAKAVLALKNSSALEDARKKLEAERRE